MTKDDQIKLNVTTLIKFLKSIKDDNEELATQSAEFIENDFLQYQQATTDTEKDDRQASLLYSIGGKGIFDSNWNEVNRAKLEILCDDLSKSLIG